MQRPVAVGALSVKQHNDQLMLVTGDDQGFVKLWDLGLLVEASRVGRIPAYVSRIAALTVLLPRPAPLTMRSLATAATGSHATKGHTIHGGASTRS